MTILPSPIPHPLDFSPFPIPGWAYEALEWVVGFDWPAGNERTTWDVADRWYAVATQLAGPREDAGDAARQVTSGYSGAGSTAFAAAWDETDAPLADLLAIADELGKLVEGCGRDIEGAKLEAWVEITLFLVELIGMAVAVALTLGAASPAAGGLITATRLAIQQIFKRLVEQLGKKAIKQSLKEAGQRAAKQLTTRAGRAHLARDAVREGFDEAGEELATNGAIQAYQNSTGRAHGISLSDAGWSAAGGFGGGFAASGAHLGGGSHHGIVRGAGAEVLGEFGGAAATGNLPDLGSLAKSASSGATGSALHSGTTGATDSLLAAMPPTSYPTPPAGDFSPQLSPSPQPSPSPPAVTDGASTPTSSPSVSTDGLAALSASPADSATSAPTATSAPPVLSLSDPASTSVPADPSTSPLSALGDPSPVSALSPSTHTGGPDLSSLAPATDPTAPSSTPSDHSALAALAPAAIPSLDSSTPAPSPLSSPPPSPASFSSAHDAPATPSSPAIVPLSSSPLSAPPSSPALSAAYLPSSPATPSSLLSTETGSPTPPPPSPTQPNPMIGNGHVPAQGPWSSPPGSRHRAPSRHTPRHSGRPTAAATASDVDRYLQHGREQRAAYAEFRRADAVDRLEQKAQSARRQARNARRAARVAKFLKLDPTLAQSFEADAETATLAADRAEAEVRVRRDPAYDTEMGAVTTVEPQDWHRANRDSGRLAPGAVTLDDRSMLTGDGQPPSINSTRQYGGIGGLRAPLVQHQLDVENAVPRDSRGNPIRLLDPRTPYFQLMNDGGPAADPTRGINCQDCVLSFFDTYMHGRPRVSAPRTFDAYRDGDPQRPLYGEAIGPERVEHATGAKLQSLCKPDPADTPAAAQKRAARALGEVSAQLLDGGHGSFAFLVSAWEGGSAHSWAAVNQNGEILFVDPQSGRVAPPGMSLYGHRGEPHPDNLIALDALVVNGRAQPLPFPHHQDGWWRPRGQTLTPPAPVQSPAPTSRHAYSDHLERTRADFENHRRTTPDNLPLPGATNNNDRPGNEDGLDLRPTGAVARGGTPPSTAEITADDFDPRAAERRVLQALKPEHSAAIRAAVVDSRSNARTVRPHLEAVVASLGRSAELVGVENAVKTERSLARAFLAEFETGTMSIRKFLDGTKDRVRFAIQVSERDYVATVRAAIAALSERDYRVAKLVNFWSEDGRHNGLNATVANASGIRFELQFPTQLSWSVNKQTHTLYEIVRLPEAPYAARVDAFLRMVAINKAADIVHHQPAGVRELNPDKTVDSSFREWVRAERFLWDRYLRELGAEQVSFDRILERNALTRMDVFGLSRSDDGDDPGGVRLPGGPGLGRIRHGDEPDRLRASVNPRPPSRPLERPTPDVDLRPGPSIHVPVRPEVPGADSAAQPSDSGSDRQGRPGGEFAGRGDSSPDVRRGRADGLGLRPSAPGGPGEIVDTRGGLVRINARLGQTPGILGVDFQVGTHYAETFEHDHERRQAAVLGRWYDVRVLDAAHDRTDSLGNPDVILRVDQHDTGSYGDLKRLNPRVTRPRDPDLSRGVESLLRKTFGQDPRNNVAVVDGLEVGLTIEDAVRGIRRALGFWRQQQRDIRPEQRMIVFLGDGRVVVWRGDSGAIDVGA